MKTVTCITMSEACFLAFIADATEHNEVTREQLNFFCDQIKFYGPEANVIFPEVFGANTEHYFELSNTAYMNYLKYAN